MQTEEIIVANIKCGGCAGTIKKEIEKLKGVANTEVDIDQDKVVVTYENTDRALIIKRLRELGYPEATEENGLLMQVKSYASCMIGRIDKLQEH